MSAIDSYDSFMSSRNTDGSSKLQRLRYHLAIEGCSDSQLSLAKSFLHDAAETDTERKENAELAVRWLLLSSSEGNQEAFQLLENCYKMGVGVTYANREHIESCLRSTHQEKLAQRVGSNLFRLIAYDTQESIPSEYFQKRISIYLNDEDVTENHNLSLDSKIYPSATYISTQDVVSSVHDCLLGKCPDINIENEPFDFFTVPDCNNSISYGKNMLRCIIKICLKSFDKLSLKLAELKMSVMLFSFVILSLTVCNFKPALYIMQYPENFIQFLEYAGEYSSSVIILVASARLVQYEKNQINIHKWKKIIYKCDIKASASIPRYNQFGYTSNLTLFTLGLILFIISDNGISCLALFGMCILISFLYNKITVGEFYVTPCIFLLLNLTLSLTRLSSEDTSNLFTEVVTFPTTPVTDQEIVLRSTSMLSVLTLILFLLVTCQNNLQTSLSFLAISVWFHIITEYVLHINKLKFLIFFFIIPAIQKLGVYTTIFVVYFVSHLGVQTDYMTFICVCLIILMSLTLTKICTLIKKTLSLSWYPIYTTLLIVMLLLFSQKLSFTNRMNFGSRTNITWNNYSKLCHRPAWAETNMVHTQLSCDKFRDQTLVFEANVNNVRKISHQITFPSVPYFELIDPIVNSYEIMLEIKGTFRIEASLLLLTDDRCKDFVLELRTGDLLSVIGTFESGLGTDKLTLILEDAQCISCMDDVKCHINEFHWYQIGIKKLGKVVAFLLYPWIK